MREENVARVRAFAEWLAGGREEAIRNAPELLGRPMAEWDAWLAAHPEAATLHLLQALLDQQVLKRISESPARGAETFPPKLGLAPEMAMQLARATVAGSGELLRQSTDPASQLRINVTSPGGTTAEALKVLMAPDGIQTVFDKALAAASRRSKELAG